MTSRYDSRIIAINDTEQYKNIFKKRGIRFMRQYLSPELRHPTADEISNLDEEGHIWSLGDNFAKLAYEAYGDAELWWVLAWYNKSPTEAHLELGQTIYIPRPLERVLQYFEV